MVARIPPMEPAIITVRSQSKHSNATFHSASPSTLRMLLAGTRQSCRWISAVGDERQPILSSSRPTTKPGVLVSTQKAVGPLSVRASTLQTSAMGPLVMKILVPLRTYSSPSRTAVVRNDAASLPDSGSVDAHAPMYVPSHRPGSHLRLSSSEPCSQIGT